MNSQCLSCQEGEDEADFCRKNPNTDGCELLRKCCQAMNSECLSCQAGKDEADFCREKPETEGCESFRKCCEVVNSQCLSCQAGKKEADFCRENPDTDGCERLREPSASLARQGETRPDSRFPNCCTAMNSQCLSCQEGEDEAEFCRKNPNTDGCELLRKCCQAMNSECLSCQAGKDEADFCREKPETEGCERLREPSASLARQGETRLDSRFPNCCTAMHSQCLSCQEGEDEAEFCRKNP